MEVPLIRLQQQAAQVQLCGQVYLETLHHPLSVAPSIVWQINTVANIIRQLSGESRIFWSPKTNLIILSSLKLFWIFLISLILRYLLVPESTDRRVKTDPFLSKKKSFITQHVGLVITISLLLGERTIVGWAE